MAYSALSNLEKVSQQTIIHPHSHPYSPTTSTATKEDPRYCAICTPLGKECPGSFATSDWDDEGDNTRETEQEQPEVNPELAKMLTQTLQPPNST